MSYSLNFLIGIVRGILGMTRVTIRTLNRVHSMSYPCFFGGSVKGMEVSSMGKGV